MAKISKQFRAASACWRSAAQRKTLTKPLYDTYEYVGIFENTKKHAHCPLPVSVHFICVQFLCLGIRFISNAFQNISKYSRSIDRLIWKTYAFITCQLVLKMFQIFFCPNSFAFWRLLRVSIRKIHSQNT